MPVHLLTGAEWTAFAKACKHAGDRGLMKQVRTAIRVSATSATDAVKESAPTYMPDNYAAEMTKTLRVTVSAVPAGVSLRGRASTKAGKKRELRRLEQGVLRHPLFGRWIRGKYLQKVQPGFWSEPLTNKADDIRRDIKQAMDQVADHIAH